MSLARVQIRKLPPCIIMVMETALGLHHAGIHLCSLSGKQYGTALVWRTRVRACVRVCVSPLCVLSNECDFSCSHFAARVSMLGLVKNN